MAPSPPTAPSDETAADACTGEASARLSAAEAGLRYSSDAEPGIRRRRRGRGFSYVRADGSGPVDAATRARIDSLAIPPAWTDVWICPAAKGHLQATGRDARGRKQYRYHPDWHAVRDEAKFDQLAAFGAGLGQVRSVVEEDLGRPGLPPRKVIALVVALLDSTLVRVGNDEYRRTNGTFGLTTLRDRQVSFVRSEMHLCFVGKGGREFQVEVDDRRLVRAARACHELGGRELFTYRGADGAPVRVDSADCNQYLAEIAGPGTTVKYFRTWGASVTALEHLVGLADDPCDSDILAAVDVAADRLGNTRAVCRRSYVHPALVDDLDPERLRDAWAGARRTATLSRAERALVRLLDSP